MFVQEMNYMKQLCFLLFVACFAESCKRALRTPQEGIYTGTMTVVHESANQWQGYIRSDTSYIDTFEVRYQQDSVCFTNNNRVYKFKWDASGKYTELKGTHDRTIFTCLNHSVQYSYSSYGGYSSAYSQENANFTGTKQ